VDQNATVNGYLKGLACTEFAAGLEQYTEFTEPMARAITCLESSTTNASDVFVAFAAMNASLDEKLRDSTLPAHESVFIRSKANFRFDQHINKNTHDIYVSAFVLDPHQCFESCP
jgi:hypothetical protein